MIVDDCSANPRIVNCGRSGIQERADSRNERVTAFLGWLGYLTHGRARYNSFKTHFVPDKRTFLTEGVVDVGP